MKILEIKFKILEIVNCVLFWVGLRFKEKEFGVGII